MLDIKPGFPRAWSAEYVSTQISAQCNGVIMKASGKNDTLSDEQKRIFSFADIGWDVVTEVKYKLPNPVTAKLENSTMNFFVTLVADSNISLPVADAEFIGGKEQMRKYLYDNAVQPISKTTPVKFQKGRLMFTISETGEVINCKVLQSSGDAKTDKLLLDTIRKMGNWKPAENLWGTKVKQDFEFSLGMGGC
jgi:TonB family protein